MTTENKTNHNLLILGIVSISIAVMTTVISVVIYHKSGDMYLDRSRPGFLPDEKEVEEEEKHEDYSLSENAELNSESLEDYLSHYKEILKDLDKVEKPFSEDPLSDKSLGIPE